MRCNWVGILRYSDGEDQSVERQEIPAEKHSMFPGSERGKAKSDSMTKPRLLVLTTTFPRWVDDHEPPFVYELAKRLTSDYQVTVLAPHAPDALRLERMEGIDVHRFRYAPERLETLAYAGGIGSNLRRATWKYLLLQGFLLSFFFSALSLVRSKQIDVIHAHWMIPSGMFGAALKILFPKLRVVVTAHGADVFQLKGKLFMRARSWVANEADAVTVVGSSLAVRAKEEGWFGEKVSIAPMGVDLEHTFVPRRKPHSRPTLVFAGRLVEKKGVHSLIEAMSLVKQSNPDTRLLVAGHGPMREALERRARELRLIDSVEFLGEYRQSELPEIFGRSDIAVLPFQTTSDHDEEGFGLTTVEALGCGLPVVVGDVPAVSDVVTHGLTGLVVDGRNSKQMADQILHLLNAPDQAQKLANAGRANVLAHFDWSVAAGRYAAVLSG